MEKGKLCDYCKKYYPENSFGVALTRNSRIYRRRKCSNCYRLTKHKLRQKYFQWLNDYKTERGCSRCKIKDPRVLDLHHRNDQDKLFTLGGLRHSLGFDRIQSEVKKCDVVCANCHRILHNEARKKSVYTGE